VKPSYNLHLDCVHPDDRAVHDRKFKGGWESDSEWHSFEHRIVRKDGEVRNILARYRFERDTQGNPLRALGTDQDITDQKISEKILAQSRDYNRAILMSMKDHIVVLNKAGQILSANSSWFEFARKNDVSSLKLISEGVNYLEVCRRASDDTDETAQKALGGIEEVLSGSQEHFALEYPCHSPSMQRWFLMNVIPFKGEKGGAVVAHTDISSRKKAEKSLIESQKEARLLTRKLLKAQESERALLARELHDDITQRLAILNIEVDELEMKHPSVSRSLKKKLRKIGNDLGALSSDVHMISRQLHPSILYDLGLVKAVKIESNNFSRIYGIAPTLNLDSTIKDVPKETAICIYRILQEGLKNIGKHARATHVQVRLYREKNFICLLLKDNGIGFELNSGVETAGIGLASMAERARMINAEYSIESEPGKGTAIKLKTPFTSNQN
jgi:signal transduction histidine kinase